MNNISKHQSFGFNGLDILLEENDTTIRNKYCLKCAIFKQSLSLFLNCLRGYAFRKLGDKIYRIKAAGYMNTFLT